MEKLSFLGDCAINFLIIHELFIFNNISEKEMDSIKSTRLNKDALKSKVCNLERFD